MEGNMLQGRSCSDLQQTAIVNRPTLAFYFSNKCVGLECKCATPLSALWPKELILLKAQQLSQPTCVGCQTFSLINLFPWWPFWGLLFSVLSLFCYLCIGCAQASGSVAERNTQKRAVQQLLCLQTKVRHCHILELSFFKWCVCMHESGGSVFICQCYCSLSLSKKLPQLFIKMPNRQHRLCWESYS